MASLLKFRQEEKMKTETSIQESDTHTITLLAAISFGLGLAVHNIFFLVAAAIALVIPVRKLVRYVYELEQRHHHA